MSPTEIYRKVRQGKFFLIGLLVFCGCWIAVKLVLQRFDPDFGLYNTILSTEASLNGTIIVMMADKFESWMKEQTLYKRAILESHQVTLSQVKELSEAVLSILKDRKCCGG